MSFLLIAMLMRLPAVPTPTADRQHQVAEPRKQPLQELMRMEVVYPQEKGEFQATAIADYQKFDGGNSFSIPVSAEYGLTDAWQIGIEWLSYTRIGFGDSRASGRGGVAVGTKYSFMQIHGWPLHAAIGVEAEFEHGPTPSGEDDGGHEVETFGAVAIDLPHRVSVFAHVGVIAARSAVDEGEPNGRLTWSTGELIDLGKAALALELNFIDNRGFRRGTGGTYLTPSVTLHPYAGWELGLGVPIGLTARSNAFGVIGHLIYER